MAVTTSIPALAFSFEPPTTARAAGSSEQGVQSVEVGSASVSVSIKRDGYSVTEAPKLVPATSGTTTAIAPVDSGQLSDQGWVQPVSGTISDPFGARPDKPVAGVGDFHKGTDIAAGCGEPVSAATAGTVVAAGWYGTYGNWVLIDHGNGIQTGYAHNGSLLVSEGQTVAAGETIAEVGSTGASTGCHVHFETRIGGTQTDAETFMSARGVTLG